jgi:hypothetical protein
MPDQKPSEDPRPSEKEIVIGILTAPVMADVAAEIAQVLPDRLARASRASGSPPTSRTNRSPTPPVFARTWCR